MNIKKLLLIFILILAVGKTNAQQFQNPSFDSVYIGGIDRLLYWITSDAAFMGGNISGDTMGPQQTNAFFGMGQGHEIFGYIDIYNASPYSPVGLKLNTTFYKKNNGTPFETYIVNGDHYYTGNDGYIDFSHCGEPFTYRPDSVKGFYQYIDSNATTTDFGKCIFLLKKYDSVNQLTDTIAYFEDSLAFAPASWGSFSIPIPYLSNAQPDSMVIIFKASTRPSEGSSFWLDNLSLVYSPNSVRSLDNSKTLPIIYPNPNSGIIYIEENDLKLTSYRLLDLTGKVLEKGDFLKEISISNSTKGMLFLELFDRDGLLKTYQVIKE